MTSEKRSYWPAIDGLRGIAVLLVVVSHTGLISDETNAGYAGVLVFFVLSGFLITTLLWQSATEGRGHLLTFYATRAVRLWPALLLLTVVVSIIWLALGRSASSIGQQAFYADLYLENLVHGRHDGQVLAHTWSLSVEEQFYLLWPFVLPAVLRLSTRGRGLALGSAVVASCIAHAALVLIGAGNQAYASLPANAYALLVGCGLALLPVPQLAGRWSVAAGTAALALSLFVVPGLPMGDYLAPLAVVGSAALLVLALRAGDPVFGSRPARYLGRVSYSWYLWHWSLMDLSNTLGHPVAGSLVAVASLGVAAASTHLVEEPCAVPGVGTSAPGARRSRPACRRPSDPAGADGRNGGGEDDR